jgi:hypothetical protein
MPKRSIKTWSFQKKLTVSASTVAALGILLTAIPKASDYIETPIVVEALAGQVTNNSYKIDKIDRYIETNQAILEAQQQWQQQQWQQPAYNPPPKRKCWDIWEDGYEYEIDCTTGRWL